ncbi:hypothetical protein DL766_009705 [Monosporascus sp. MC13-8B]|uniref:Uncharacterized protein n=1 Tax=Monosporascus cannonballus TaxID=155416 RepID=A0ABY0GZP4_9PEZI|nr:hypothetical protein DL763_009377 [Monosporascus cannonballus]RYO80907.1 hypothetical protein DL762_007396 [Monosporascus cannonballus]RYP14354.1 hypothetical protein DL766_009705 [Monosporascus sp. MC13-8B]
MRLYVALTNIILSVPVLKAAASPAFSQTTLQERQGFDWDKCTRTGPESCTVYMATSDGTTRNEYRIATLYDWGCNVVQVYETDPHNTKIVLKGNLPHYVDLYVDSFYRPNGHLSYYGQDYQRGDGVLQISGDRWRGLQNFVSMPAVGGTGMFYWKLKDG